MPNRRVIVRDFLLFQFKLMLDGLKDVVLFNASIMVVLIDVVFHRPRRPRLYRLLEAGERFDLWLNLHRAAGRIAETDDGLFGASRAGDDTLLGRVEQVVRGGDEPRSSR